MRGWLPMVLLSLTLWSACGGGGDDASLPAQGPAAGGELTAFQVEHGIGPITEPVALGSIDRELAEEGKELFEVKCSACHKFSERYVGPALGGITTRRSPAYIMNMLLNPQEMIERHPAAKQLLAEFLTYMPNQGLDASQARQVLEYLRTREAQVAP